VTETGALISGQTQGNVSSIRFDI